MVSKSSITTLPQISRIMPESAIPSDINALPTDWVPNNKPSKVVEKVLADREHLYERRLAQLEDDMTKIKNDTEAAIHSTSTKMRDVIQTTKKTVEDIIDKYTFRFNDKNTFNFSSPEMYDEMFQYVKNIVANHCARMKADIGQHDSELKAIEHKRMASLAGALRSARANLDEQSCALPHELQLYFENEMMQLNQMTLCNQYAYSELKAQLMNVALSSEHAWLNRIDRMRDECAAKYAACLKRESASLVADDELTLDEVRAFTERTSMEVCQLGAAFEGSLKVIYQVLNRIESGRYDEVQQMEASFVGLPTRDYLSIRTEVYASLFEEECFEIITSFTLDMMQRWQNAVDALADEVRLCKRATLRGMHVFDEHFERRLELTRIFALDLWDMVQKSLDAEDVILVELHRAMDEVRTAPDESRLKSAMGGCKQHVDAVNRSIHKNHEKHVKYFDVLRDLMVQESGIVYLEISNFVKCMPSGDDVNPTIFRGRRSRIKFIPPEKKPDLMKAFDADIKAMHNWLYGVSEHLKKDPDWMRERALNDANSWIDKTYVIVFWHYKLKTQLVADQWQKIFHHVYRVRLAELLTHRKRLDEHLLGIREEMRRLSPTDNADANVFNQHINALRGHVKKLRRSLQKANSSAKTTGIAKQLRTFKDSCLKDMQKVKAGLDVACTRRLNELLCLNVAYIRSVKFFGEGGNYHVEEFNEVKRALTKANKDMMNEKTDLDREREEVMERALQEVAHIEEALAAESAEVSQRFEFKEFLKEHVAGVRDAVKQQTQLLIDKSNLLVAHVERLQSLAESNVGHVEYLDDFTSNCEYMERIFMELHEEVFQPEAFNLSDSFFLRRAPGADDDARSASGRGSVVLENLQAQPALSDYRIVFPAPPAGDGYMARIARILFDSLECLQARAQEHYRAAIEDRAQDADGGSCNERVKTFMITYLAKYLFYQLQCDEFLLEVMINYILELDELLTYITDYYKRSLEQFVDDKLADLRKNCASFKSETRLCRQDIEDSYRTIMDELKPLHGHPKNKNLLAEITNKLGVLEEHAVGEQEKMDNLHAQYQATMDENMGTFAGQVDLMETRLKSCVERFVARYIENAAVFDQVRSKLAYFEKITQPGETVIDGSNATINLDIMDHLNSKLQLLKMGLKVSSTAFATLIHTKWTEATVIREKYASDDHLLIGSASSLDFYLIMDDFREKQLDCLRELEASKGVVETCEFWANIWQRNVEQVNALYQVKYVPPPKVDEPPKQRKPKAK